MPSYCRDGAFMTYLQSGCGDNRCEYRGKCFNEGQSFDAGCGNDW